MMTTYFRPATLARSLFAAAALSGALLATGVQAQGYTGPSTASASAQKGYSGPSSIAVTTVKALTENGQDDQDAVLRGRIVSHDGGDHYTFEDETGRISADISKKHFPAGVKIDDKTKVELRGELDRDRKGVEFDVDSITVL